MWARFAYVACIAWFACLAFLLACLLACLLARLIALPCVPFLELPACLGAETSKQSTVQAKPRRLDWARLGLVREQRASGSERRAGAVLILIARTQQHTTQRFQHSSHTHRNGA
jgi:hypothetical protein